MNNIFDFFDLESDVSNELILKKIHFKRTQNVMPDFIIEFLENEYLKTNDIRFFNELLWVVNADATKLKQSIIHFNSNYINHIYNFCFDKKFEDCLKLNTTEFVLNKNDFNNKKIALIGNPIHFILPFLKFKKNKIALDVINVKYHPSKIMKILFYNKIFSLIFKLVFGKGYYEINIDNKTDLRSFKIPKKYDVGFHKLSFIIRENIISSFRLGLINDHWGALPLFKGKSTLLYSKLFGANLTITNHLINKEIDSGKILMYTNIKTKSIKKEIYFGLSDRIFKSTCLLCKNKFIELDNKQGHTFYETHPWLIHKIKKIN